MVSLLSVRPREELDYQHPQYAENASAWEALSILRRGGQAVRANAAKLLRPALKEPDEVFQYRCKSITYRPILEYISAWYARSVFEQAPAVETPEGDEFWAEFVRDVTYTGEAFGLTDYLGRKLDELLFMGCGYTLIDFPATQREPMTRADQIAAGDLRAYWAPYSAHEVINWADAKDGKGLEWAIIKTDEYVTQPFGKPVKKTVWRYVDRQQSARYVAIDGQKDDAVLDSSPVQHRLAGENLCPLVRVTSPGEWFGGRSLSLILGHLNKTASLDFALDRANHAVPVLIGDDLDKRLGNRGPMGAILLPPNSTAAYLEPSGKTFDISRSEIKADGDDIYRMCGLVAMSRDASATAAAASAISKQQDMAPSGPIRQGFADRLATHADRCMKLTAIARGQRNAKVSVVAPKYEDADDLATVVTKAESVRGLNVGSPTLEREINKQVAAVALPGSALLDQIKDEIDKAPTADERAQLQFERMTQRMQGGLDAQLQ